MDNRVSKKRFVGADIWPLLTPEQQQKVGSLTLEMAMAFHLHLRSGEEIKALYAQAAASARNQVVYWAMEAVRHPARDALDPPDGWPMPSLLEARAVVEEEYLRPSSGEELIRTGLSRLPVNEHEVHLAMYLADPDHPAKLVRAPKNF